MPTLEIFAISSSPALFLRRQDLLLAHYNYFCIDCEDCPDNSPSPSGEPSGECDHTSHPRRVLKDIHAVSEHLKSAISDHRNKKFQPVQNFVNVKMRVRLCDLAYTEKYGNRIRKKFKKAAQGDIISRESFRIPIKCKICCVVASNNLEVFRHIREEHLTKKE